MPIDLPDGTAGGHSSVEPGSIPVMTYQLRTMVTTPLTTVHLPPERAVLTTPGMLGVMEQCIAEAEAAAGQTGWLSATAVVKHRAGLRPGEELTVAASAIQYSAQQVEWHVTATSADARLIGEGTITRVRGDTCPS
jgi:predicted thioesterase